MSEATTCCYSEIIKSHSVPHPFFVNIIESLENSVKDGRFELIFRTRKEKRFKMVLKLPCHAIQKTL